MFKNKRSTRINSIATRSILAVLPVLTLLLCFNNLSAQSKVIAVDGFDKVVVSPHIEVVFVEGDTASVTVESIAVPMGKFNVEVKRNTLSVYLEGARTTTATKKEKRNGNKRKVPIYKGTVVKAIVTYKKLKSLDLRGEQRFTFESPIHTNELRFRIYGASQVYVEEVNVKDLQVAIYGESFLEIKKGEVIRQKYTAYGESTVNAANVKSYETKLTAYGDGTFQFNVVDRFKVTAYGDATITFTGKAKLDRGLVIGETTIVRTDY